MRACTHDWGLRLLFAIVALWIVTETASPARASVVALRDLVSGNPSLIHHYTFEGGDNAGRLLDKAAGGADLSVVSYGSGSSTIGASNGIRFDGPSFDGTTTSLTTFNNGGGYQSGGAGLSTLSDVALPSTMTVETIFRPLATPDGEGYGLSTRQTGNQRGYYVYQSPGDRLATVIGDSFDQADNNRTVLRYFRPGDWYYMANTYAQSGAATTISSYVANLSQGDIGLTKVLDGVTASGNYGGAAPLGVGVADFTKVGNGFQRAYSGQLDEIAVYNAALDRAALQSHLTSLVGTAAPSKPGLVGHWTFDADFTDSAGEHDGVATGATLVPGGKVGGATSFDGNDDRVVISKDVIPQQIFSLAFWEYAPGTTGTNDGYIVGAGSGPGFNEIFLRRYASSGGAADDYAGDIAYPSGTFGDFGPYARDQWHHHVVTQDSSGVGRWYIDGALAAEQPTSNFAGLNNDLFLGNRADLQRDYEGLLDDVQVYDQPLNVAQATALHMLPGTTLDLLIFTPVPIANPSFESPDIPASEDGILIGTPIAGWYESASAGPGQDGPNSHPMNPGEHDGGQSPVASHGLQVANLNTRSSGVTDTWIFQSLGIVEVEELGTTLMLEADVAARVFSTPHDGAEGMAAFVTGVSVDDMGVNVGDMRASALDPAVRQGEGFHGLLETITLDSDLLGEELWMRLSVHDPAPNTGSDQYFFDNVRVTQLTQIPEPSSIVLLALTLAMTAVVRPRHRKNA